MNDDEIKILQYLDNTLSKNQRVLFEKEMKNNPELNELVAAMKASVLPYDIAYLDQEKPNALSVPSSLISFVDQAIQSGSQSNNSGLQEHSKKSYSNLLKIACFAFALFYSGFLSHSILNKPDEQGLMAMHMAIHLKFLNQ